ncbi:ABC transporter ATP-binding protein [Rugosimonospora africana]|uniref:Dipeptide/oligopeptide/nickel ABC transporter ATP-binding protein n=1 Tax=Rugosimonospora africana TaxID=556532 RepID=A0A8J3VSB5_9ACTN|nr:ABC transporter ATP-binding protein [Rugosimonospora africana]GIH16288.1 dipeptide/oligopeptide/nickel ABC transporter ATP-binding protein [Rugosimonospora africana]
MTELAVSHLSKTFVTHDRGRRVPLRAVDDVSFVLRSGHTVALVGESGSGKSTIARMLARLVRPTSGEIRLDGVPVPGGYRAVRRYRGTVQMIFQDPFASLNPTHTVGYHLRRPLRLHDVAEDRPAAQEAMYGLLARVNLSPAELMAGKYPHELSGGQRQRVAIARALAPRPRVLLADEPVSMLDVSIRLEILNLIERLKREDDLAVLYVTHDLATARYFATEAMVMYRGQVVESGSSDDVILRPAHPYTQLLASAAPDPTARRATTAPRDLAAAGSGPNGGAGNRSGRPAPDGGCLFRNRCPHAMEVCRQPVPVFAVDATHTARCWLYRDADQARAHAADAPA